MNTSLINVKNTEIVIKKWAVSTILICGTFGLLYQIGNIYQYKQSKVYNDKFIDTNNILFALKKGWFITVLNVILAIILFINIKYVYVLNYSLVFTYVLMFANFIILFELIMTNLFFAMYAADDIKIINVVKKSLLVSNLNIGLSILMLLLAVIIFSCIVVLPFTSYILVPFYLMCLHKVYSKLEIKYNETENNNEKEKLALES